MVAAAQRTPLDIAWIQQREQAVAWLRFAFAVLALGVVALNPARTVRFHTLSTLSLWTFLIYSAVALIFVRKARLANNQTGVITTTLDVVWIALIVVSTGGSRTPFFFYYSFPVITASLRWGLKGSLPVSLVGIGLYTFMRWTRAAESGAPIGIDFIVIRSVYLAVLAAIFGYISDFERKQNQRLLALSRTAEQVAALQERRRIMYELHDGILQSLATLILRLEACRAQPGRSDGDLSRALCEIEDLARDTMKEIRHFLSGKDTQPLLQGTLADRLRDELRFLRDGLGVRAILECKPEEINLPFEVERELYFVIREGLTNITRHSHATHVEITLLQREKSLQGIIVDDGVGIDLSAKGAAQGVGLKSMKERLKKIGGEFEIKSSPGAGTNITFVVPLAN